ncbi:MarR family transcriptional regulator [Rossellomorea vietnamensis]|uniref:MarR family transcriptional regulator n=1 Tax=Rossellomorea vietnamensis TaxID=218284 RepID=A0A6I6UUX8_9BACI|nr:MULTISPECIES: MarR family transcriptional regulator [Rossellomorea]QHE62626.1 MarR family transcriptional regulator [Rossellomorea vietnamensis]UTE76785.1 MarR family transcriptional regulator [Rossellomorea sp. KS-H15a]
MEQILREFIVTLDTSFKKLVQETIETAGVSNLSVNQIQYIQAIGKLGNPTISEIADSLNITKASATAGINKLVSLGYAKKTQSTEDKRIYHVTLTESSLTFMRLNQQALEDYVSFIEHLLTAEETEQFKRTMEKLIKGFYEKNTQ